MNPISTLSQTTPGLPENHSAVQSAVCAAVCETEENALLRVDAAAGDASPIYGGLAHRQVVSLIRIYQAGTIDPVAFMLALAWWRTKRLSPALLNATAAYIQNEFGKDEPRLIYEFYRAIALLSGHSPGSINRALIGHVNWWKVQILEYMLQNPKPAYQIREFVRLLKPDSPNIVPKDVRAFCKKHNIARDSRPGRPTKKGTA